MVSGTIIRQNLQPSIQTMVADTFLSPRFMRKSSNGDATEKFAFDSLELCITGAASLRMLKKTVQQGRSE